MATQSQALAAGPHPAFNWMQLLSTLLTVSGPLVTAIEGLHKGKSGAEKKAAALNIVGLGDAVAQTIEPQYKPAFDAAALLAGTVIDATVKDKNQSGEFAHTATAEE
jgi:hypothetical protein